MNVLKLGFAAYSITYMVRNTDGPLDLFLRFRKLVGIRYLPVYEDDHTQVSIIEEIPENYLAKLVGCFWCLCTWISFILSVISGKFSIIDWFASIGIAGFLYKIADEGADG